MATNHTTSYALNLWEPTDKFVREEFNENTSKIDEALAVLNTGLEDKAGAWKYIGQHTNSGTFSSTSITLPADLKINWSDWEQVAFLGDINIPDCDSSDFIEFEMNPGIQTLARLKAGSILVLLFPHHDDASKISGFGIGNGVAFFSSENKYREITSFFVSLRGNAEHRIHGMSFRFFGTK